MQTKIFGLVLASTLVTAALFGGSPSDGTSLVSSAFGVKTAQGDEDPAKGTKTIYGPIPADQVEFLSSGDQIVKAASSGASTAIWEILEHGERVECLNCIPAVEPLLYDANPKTREIAAWWLRRRTFGVFGPGEVYERTAAMVKDRAQTPSKRANAAYALGEFLVAPGADVLADVLSGASPDPEPRVRAAAASALGRLNSDGSGALARALADGDSQVKLAALGSASIVNTSVDATSVARLMTDGDGIVRRRAAEVLETLRAKDAVVGLMSLAKSDGDAEVRLAACHALGGLGDSRARTVLEDVAATDANGLVKDQARIALRRL